MNISDFPSAYKPAPTITTSGGYVETTSSARPQTYAATRELIPVDRQELQAVLDRLTTLETEVRTLKTQTKLAAGFIKNGDLPRT